MHPPVRLVAIDMDGTLLPTFAQALTPRTARALKAAQQAGITVAIATGPARGLHRAAAGRPRAASGYAADHVQWSSDPHTGRRAPSIAASMESRVARGLCGLLRPFGAVVFTFDRPGRGELVLEDLDQAHGRIALWVEANRNAIEVVKPLEDALVDGEDPIQGMAAGGAEPDAQGRAGGEGQRVGRSLRVHARPSIRGAICRFWTCCRRESRRVAALERLAARLGVDRKETMAIGDNWNDVEMLEWAGQAVMMGNAARELRTHGEDARLEAGSAQRRGWRGRGAGADARKARFC